MLGAEFDVLKAQCLLASNHLRACQTVRLLAGKALLKEVGLLIIDPTLHRLCGVESALSDFMTAVAAVEDAQTAHVKAQSKLNQSLGFPL